MGILRGVLLSAGLFLCAALYGDVPETLFNGLWEVRKAVLNKWALG